MEKRDQYGSPEENQEVWGGIRIRRKENRPAERRIRIRERGGVVYLTFPVLENLEGITHAFSTRLGGVSEGAVGSLNLGFGREPERENVLENHRRLAEAVGYPAERTVFSRQTHTANIRVVTEADCGKGFVREPDYTDVDGLVTNVPGIPLVTFYADCVPLLLVDPVHRAIGCSHSGWKGTVANIGRETLAVMKREYGTEPEDVYAAIGPSICQDCYEVSRDVADRFRRAYPEAVWPLLLKPGAEEGKEQLNLWEACRQNFLAAGVLPDHIGMPDLCTCCNADFLFSHRASGGKRGNLAAVLMLNPE